MTDLRSATQDAFERELRVALLTSTAPHAPRSLSLAAAAIVARPARVRRVPWGRVAAAALAAVFGLAAIGFGMGPVTSILQPAIAPAMSPTAALPSFPASPGASPDPSSAASPAAPSVSPSVAPTPWYVPTFDLRADQIRLTADDIILEVAGERLVIDPEHTGAGSNLVSTASRWTMPLLLGTEPPTKLVYLDLRSDATDWWVERALLSYGPRPITRVSMRGPIIRTPIGQALSGELTFTGELNGVPVRFVLTRMTLDPVGLGTGPHDWEGCTRFTDLDAAAKASLRDAKRPAKVAAIAKKLDLCVIYLWSFKSTEGGHLVEIWCTPPTSGAIASIRAGESGEAVVDVIDAPRTQAPRPQPIEGWGCDPEPEPSPASPG